MNIARNESRARVAAVVLACAATLVSVSAPLPARAHGAADQAAAAPATPSPNRWGAGYFPNVELITQDGKKVRLYDDLLKGKSVAINAFFTECEDACPLETAMLLQLQRLLGERVGKDIFFYSVSIDPVRDTPAALKAYAQKFGIGGGWLLLTGKPEDIRLVTRKLGLLRSRDADTREGHSAILMVGNEPTGQWMKNAATDNPSFLAERIGGFLGWRDTQPAKSHAKSYAEARPIAFETGQYVFQSRCSACHTIGQGDKIGPDLLGVTARRDREWLSRYIRTPERVLAAGDPAAAALFKKYREVRMPNLRLAADEVADVLSYIDAQTAALAQKTDAHSGHHHHH